MTNLVYVTLSLVIIFLIFPALLAFLFISRSKKKILVGGWFIIGYGWAFFSVFSRAVYVEQDFVESPFWRAITLPMVTAQNWAVGALLFWLQHDLALSIGELLLFPLSFVLSLIYLWLLYIFFVLIKKMISFFGNGLQNES